MKEIVLKSPNTEEYPDEVVVCKEIANEDINDYIASIPEERKVLATKVAPVIARVGKVGEKIHTVLFTERNGKTYILSEEDAVVKENELDGTMVPDVVVTNINSTSNEQYVVKAKNFARMYVPNADETWTPQPEERELVKVDEDVIITTAWGSEAVCLKGSYIVVYNAEENDFNTLEQGAMKSTYEVTSGKQKIKTTE